jgi:hypothetical protein
MNKYLVIFVEGLDDKRFFEKIIQPVFEDIGYYVIVWDYKKEPIIRIRKFLRSIFKMGGYYIYTADIDDSPCITHKKQRVRQKLSQVDPERIAVVTKEIESWYLAVLDDCKCPISLRNCCLSNTDDIDKEKFRSLKPKKYSSDTDFMLEILKYPSIDKAINRNRSFQHFYVNHCC